MSVAHRGHAPSSARMREDSINLPTYISIHGPDSKNRHGYKVHHPNGRKAFIDRKFTMEEKFQMALKFRDEMIAMGERKEDLPMYVKMVPNGYEVSHPKYYPKAYTSSKYTKEEKKQMALDQLKLWQDNWAELQELKKQKSSQ